MSENTMPELRGSNEAREDVAELRRRLDDDGYLFFKRLLDPDRLHDLRREMLTVMQEGGWLVKGTDPVDGIASLDARCTEGDLGYTDVYHEVYKLQSFHEIAHCRAVMDLLEDVRGCPMMPQPQKVARLWFPKFTEHTTPIHQDFVHFQGTHENLTCWSPVGDCPIELGGLAVLRGSHKVDRVLDHHFSLGAGSLHVDPDEHSELDGQWHTTNYEIGDTLIFPALTVHQALPNLTEDRLRVSLDNRYQRVGDPIAEHMLMPHLSSMSPLPWDEVYKDWDSTETQYYWAEYDNPVLSKITVYLDQGFDEACELAQSGDERAQLHLRRISVRDPSSEQGQRASTVLASLSE
ncbi:MAG: phytanoyl-CoA dioxygenase [Planctomycetaceae bacterium]|nr:phytanoyl-CoA dioxygenase [Planctomycetaceae bacterium]